MTEKTEYNVRLQQIDECPLCEMESTYIYKVREGQRTPNLAVGKAYPYRVTARVCCGETSTFYHLDVEDDPNYVSSPKEDESDVSDDSSGESLYDTHG